MTGERRGARLGGAGDRGAALVEAAIVTPVVVAGIVALVVSSLLWRDQLAVSDAAAAGVRAAALYPAAALPGAAPVASSARQGTPRVAAAVAAALGGVPPAAVERVVIFGAPAGFATVASVPWACRFGGGPGPADACVLLGPEAVADPAALPECGPGACAWRDTPGVTTVGVLVRVRHASSLGGVVPAPTMEAVAVAPIEGRSGG